MRYSASAEGALIPRRLLISESFRIQVCNQKKLELISGNRNRAPICNPYFVFW